MHEQKTILTNESAKVGTKSSPASRQTCGRLSRSQSERSGVLQSCKTRDSKLWKPHSYVWTTSNTLSIANIRFKMTVALGATD